MDPASLAASAVTFLTPFLVKVGEKSAEKVGENLPEAVGKVWGAVFSRFKDLADSGGDMEDLVSDPEDKDNQASFRKKLRKAFEADSAFGTELEDLLQAAGGMHVGDTIINTGSGAGATSGGVAAGEGGIAFQGDVYGGLHYHADTPHPERHSSLRKFYLNWLINEVRDVPLSGVDPKSVREDARQDLDLAAVYMALMTQQSDNTRDREIWPERKEHRLSALGMVNTQRRLALLGEPGSGKSTFVNYLALCLAGEQLGLTEANLKTLTAPIPEERRWISSDEGQVRPQPWDRGALLPVRVILRDFVARGLPLRGNPARVNGDTLWQFIVRELPQNLHDFSQDLMAELRDTGGILLLDGLDEVPEAEQRRVQVKAAVEGFARIYPKVVVMVTSRTYSYQKQDWKLRGFAEAVLAPFDPLQINRFVERWYAFVGPLRNLSPEDAKGRAVVLNKAISSNPRLQELAARPLLLTLMASVHAWRGGTLPDQREELYADAVDLLLDQWESQKLQRQADGVLYVKEPSLTEWLETDQKAMRGMLNRLAFEAHLEQPDLVGTADVSQDALVIGLLRLSPKLDLKPGPLVEYLCNRAGLLIPRGVGVYAFSHRTFQEYLAACYLTEQDDFPENIAELARSEPNRWREVTLLAGAKAVRGASRNAWELADALCFEEKPMVRQVDQSGYWGAMLGAQVLVESRMLAQVSARNQDKVNRLRQWLTCALIHEALSPVDRAQAGMALASFGDPRFRSDAWHLPNEPLLGFVEVPAGPFLMGSDRKIDPDADDDELGQHPVPLPGYYMARYPVTVAQYGAFLQDSQYQPQGDPDNSLPSNHPATAVSWHDALAYCRWLTEKLREWSDTPDPLATLLCREGWKVSLPSEAQWEKAARGTDGRLYPWEGSWDPAKANSMESGIGSSSAVGCFPSGASSFGCMDMAGNVWEWTRSLWGNPVNPEFTYPYDPGDGREDLDAGNEVPRVLRGGSFGGYSWLLRCAFRNGNNPDSRDGLIGFRVVVLP